MIPRRPSRPRRAIPDAGSVLGVPPFVTRDCVDLFAIEWPTSGGHTTKGLGSRPRNLRREVEQTVQWLESGTLAW